MEMEIRIDSPEQVAALPWAGNYEDDAPLGRLVADYIKREPELAKRQRAEELLNWHMCGEEVSLVGSAEDPRDDYLLD